MHHESKHNGGRGRQPCSVALLLFVFNLRSMVILSGPNLQQGPTTTGSDGFPNISTRVLPVLQSPPHSLSLALSVYSSSNPPFPFITFSFMSSVYLISTLLSALMWSRGQCLNFTSRSGDLSDSGRVKREEGHLWNPIFPASHWCFTKEEELFTKPKRRYASTGTLPILIWMMPWR